jgi:rod shape-determining protein MreD
VLVGIHQLIGYWVNGLTGGSNHTLAFLIPALMSAIIWPLVRLSLDRLRL